MNPGPSDFVFQSSCLRLQVNAANRVVLPTEQYLVVVIEEKLKSWDLYALNWLPLSTRDQAIENNNLGNKRVETF